MSTDERASTRQRAAVIHRIRTLMEFWGITVSELRRFRPEHVPQRLVLAKYRHPTTGETWDGKGTQPDWLRAALLREGFTVDELRQAAVAHVEVDGSAHAASSEPVLEVR